MGRGKIEIKRIENPTNRQVTFSKRRGGLLKKAQELAILCDAQVGVVVFSASGKMFDFCSEPMSMQQLIERYQRASNTRFNDIDNQQQIIGELARMKNETERLQASMRPYSGDLSSCTFEDLSQLEQQLELSVIKVRERKHQLLNQQLDNLRRKEHILEDQNSYMYRVISENQHEVKVADQMQLLDHFGNFYPTDEESSRPLLQLSPHLPPFRLQPTQPNLHQESSSMTGHSLQLWYIISVLSFYLLST